MPTKGYRTTAEREAARLVALAAAPTRSGLLAAAAAVEAAAERPNQMSFGEQVVEAIGEHIDARISYAHSRLSSGAEWANPDEVTKSGERLQALLDKVRFAL